MSRPVAQRPPVPRFFEDFTEPLGISVGAFLFMLIPTIRNMLSFGWTSRGWLSLDLWQDLLGSLVITVLALTLFNLIPYYLTRLVVDRPRRSKTPRQGFLYGLIGCILSSIGLFVIPGPILTWVARYRLVCGDGPWEIFLTLAGCAVIALCMVEPFPLTLRVQRAIYQMARAQGHSSSR